jgi:pentapeptide MXKDX repeat protein
VLLRWKARLRKQKAASAEGTWFPPVTFPSPAHPNCSPQVQPCRTTELNTHLKGEHTMKKLFSSFALACMLTASLSAFAQDAMKQDSMKQDTAQQDSMKKDDSMKNDSMKKDDKKSKKAKKDAMKKDDKMKKDDSMKHDDMKKDDSMKNDQMKQN